MNARTIILVLLFATAIPTGINAATVANTNAATVNSYSSTGTRGSVFVSSGNDCSSTQMSVSFTESTTNDNGPPTTPVPFVYFSIFFYSDCDPDNFQYYNWTGSTSANVTYSKTLGKSVPKTLNVSVVDMPLTGGPEGLTITMQLNLVSAGMPYDNTTSIHTVYPSANNQPQVFDQKFKTRESPATGSLTITGVSFQYSNPSVTGSLGIDTLRQFTVMH